MEKNVNMFQSPPEPVVSYFRDDSTDTWCLECTECGKSNIQIPGHSEQARSHASYHNYRAHNGEGKIQLRAGTASFTDASR
jgi:hypothetical protein